MVQDNTNKDDFVVYDSGPRFSLHCVGSLLLPTLQAWLRRPITSMNTACWDTTTVANFKHYTGLCVDLVVELVVQFTGLGLFFITQLRSFSNSNFYIRPNANICFFQGPYKFVRLKLFFLLLMMLIPWNDDSCLPLDVTMGKGYNVDRA